MKKKKLTPKPRPKICWASMHRPTRTINQVYPGYKKDYVNGDLMDDEVAVRVRVVPV